MKIPNRELVALYLYIQLSIKIVKGEQIHKDKKEIDRFVLHDFFIKQADFIVKFKESSESSSEEEVVNNNNNNSNQKAKKKTQKKPMDTGPKIEFNAYDFPTLRTSLSPYAITATPVGKPAAIKKEAPVK